MVRVVPQDIPGDRAGLSTGQTGHDRVQRPIHAMELAVIGLGRMEQTVGPVGLHDDDFGTVLAVEVSEKGGQAPGHRAYSSLKEKVGGRAVLQLADRLKGHGGVALHNPGGDIPITLPGCVPNHYPALFLSLLLDQSTFRELDAGLASADPLGFPGYPAKLDQARRRTGMNEAVVTALGRMGGQKVAAGVLDSRFFMGSMSAALGEKVTRLIELAGKNRLPLILCSASGGARMQEGILSLMQMAKTAAALERFSQKGGLYVSVLTHPTTGGVTASFASLGDITLAEPGALIGFAGPRVIEQTIGETLPEGFQRAEYLLEHGFLDAIVPRPQLRDTLIQLLRLHGKGGGDRGK